MGRVGWWAGWLAAGCWLTNLQSAGWDCNKAEGLRGEGEGERDVSKRQGLSDQLADTEYRACNEEQSGKGARVFWLAQREKVCAQLVAADCGGRKRC